MKPSEKSNKPDNAKQKKQMLILGGLSAVFAAVLAIQFGGSSKAPEASAMTEPEPDASVGVPDDSGAAPAEASTPIPMAKENAVLAQPIADGGITRSPFSNFWNVTPTGGSSIVPAVSAPTITLNATMPSANAGLAVIDGALHFVGDSIQGWALAEVSPRSVTLRAPAGETVVVEMPLLVGRVSLPEQPAGDPTDTSSR